MKHLQECRVLTAQNTQYNPMDTIPPTDAIGCPFQQTSKKEFLLKDHLEPHDSSRSAAGPMPAIVVTRTFLFNSHLANTHPYGRKPYAL
ncbi:hypothetical protein CEXT_773891 [Caerostris extrusa]|uniref:C2H2-type domain-containing protein n=1 Tax=Caerostris extrusa TaxID=172846 RepID=A0AAV4RL73_CAEEX|nr:hypothetical protein CEXT_773891 [Caerostris extrusa]